MNLIENYASHSKRNTLDKLALDMKSLSRQLFTWCCHDPVQPWLQLGKVSPESAVTPATPVHWFCSRD